MTKLYKKKVFPTKEIEESDDEVFDDEDDLIHRLHSLTHYTSY